MSQRKFAIGDRVRLAAHGYSVNDPHDIYTISRMLPADANVWQYRMKRVGDGQERAATELQLVKMVSEERIGRAPIEQQRGPWPARNGSITGRVPGGKEPGKEPEKELRKSESRASESRASDPRASEQVAARRAGRNRH